MAPAEHDIVEATGGNRCLHWQRADLVKERKAAETRGGEEEMKGALFKNRSAVLILPQLEVMAKLLSAVKV